MIKIAWKSFTDYDLVLEIDDGSETVANITPSAKPFVTQGDDSNDMFQPIRAQSGNIGIVATLAEFEQLVGNYPLQRPVTLKSLKNGTFPVVQWRGYIQSAAYSQDWIGGNMEISVPVVSRIGVWEHVSLPPASVDLFMSFADIIKHAGNAVGGFEGYVFPTFINSETTLGYKVLMRNFATRDNSVTSENVYETATYEELITAICKLFGLVCIEYQKNLCFIAPDYSGNYIQYSETNLDQIDNGESATSPQTLTGTVVNSTVNRADNSISYLQGKRRVKVTGKVNPFDLTLITVDGDKMILGDTLGQLWSYGNQPDCYFTKCLLTDQQSNCPVSVMGVGFEYNGHINNPTTNMNVRWQNFNRAESGQATTYYGCSYVCERQYYGVTRDDSVGKDTGWQFKTLFRMKSAMIPSSEQYLLDPIVTFKSNEKVNYSYLWSFTDRTDPNNPVVRGAKYLSINGNVRKCSGETLQHDWEAATGYFYMKVSYGTDLIYQGYLRYYEGKFSGGNIANHEGTFSVDQKGFVIQLDNSLITERNATLRVQIYAINYSSIAGGVEADKYYSIEGFNVTVENRWSELDAPMNEREENVEKEDTEHGWVEDLDVEIPMTTAPDFTSRKISAQFGSGIVLANNVMEENPHVLYSSKSAELALKDRLVAHYSDSKKMLEASVVMPPTNYSYGPLQPWQTHSPNAQGSWAVLAQTIDWRDDVITGKFFER